MANTNYYDDKSWSLIFNLIKSANPDINFTKEQVRLTELAVNDGPDKDVNNTKGVLVGIPEMGREGSFPLTWNRPDIGQIFSNIPTVYIAPNGQKKKSDLLVTLNALYNFQLQASDIYDSVLNMAIIPQQVTLPIRENNPAFTGTLTVTVGDPQLQLESVLRNSALAGLEYPTGQAVKIQGPYYLYGFDFTYAKDQLTADFTYGAEITGALLEAFNQKAPDEWVNLDSAQDFNMRGSKVAYNGLTGGAPVYCNRDLYTHCVVITLDDDMCANVSKHVILHYNG